MRKKVLFFLYSLSGGGAERTVINIINNLDKEKYDVLLVLGTDKNNDYRNYLDKNIKTITLNCSRLRYSVFKLAKCIRDQKPDLLFSTINANNIIILLAKLISFRNIPIIVREASNRTESGKVSLMNKIITNVLYNNISNKIVALSKGVKKDLINNFKIKKQYVEVIYNPIEVDHIRLLSNEPVNDLYEISNERILIAVGRLVKSKGFNTLLKAFKNISCEIDSHLIILGKGPEEKNLKKLAMELGVQKKVSFLGFKTNPYKYMRQADLFILSSKYEGFGHVIVEAMATGTPVVSTNCKSGPLEIIKKNKYGQLIPVDNVKIMAETVIKILKDQKLLDKMAINGCRRAKFFDAKNIVQQYEELFRKTIKNQKG